MDRNRLLMIGAALAAVVVIAGGFFLGVSPQLKAAQTAQATQASTVTQNATLAASLTTLKSQYSKLDSLQEQLGVLQASVPSTAGSAAFISEVNALAKSTGVKLNSLAIGDASAYASPVATAPTAAATSTASPSPSASASASASATPTASAAPTPASPSLATSPLITAANFSDLPVTVDVTGTYTQGLAFLQALRSGQRLFVPSTIGYGAAAVVTTGTTTTVAPTTGSSSLDWKIGGLIYALTDTSTGTSTSQTATSTAAGATTGTSSPDAAAGK